MVWRIVLSNIATLEEIERSWSFDDLVRANLALTYHIACQNAELEASR